MEHFNTIQVKFIIKKMLKSFIYRYIYIEEKPARPGFPPGEPLIAILFSEQTGNYVACSQDMHLRLSARS